MKQFIQFPFTRFVLGAVLVAGTYIGTQQFTNPFLAQFAGQAIRFPLRLLVYLSVTALVVGAYALYWRWVERRPMMELQPQGAVRDLSKGFFFTLLVASLVLGPLWLHGNLVIEKVNGWRYLPQNLGLAIMSATAEEIFFRGLLFRLTEEKLGSAAATAISALLFGAAHYANPGTTFPQALGIGLEAGLALSALYMLTRTLWLCIATHATWNLLSGVLGLPDSGTATYGYFSSRLVGDERLTGGVFGVEASWWTIALGIGVGAYLVGIAYRHKKFKRPFWAAASSEPRPYSVEVNGH